MLNYTILSDVVFSGSEDCTDDGDEDYNFIADANAQKARRLANKRRNNIVDANRSKIRKASDNSSAGKTLHSGPKSNITSDKPNSTPTIKLTDTSSFFYKFVCEWYASAAQYGVDSALSKPIKCKRKFNNLKEAIDHLQMHHIGKLISNDEPFRCAWQDCDSGEFSDEEGIKEHVVYHAKGKKNRLNLPRDYGLPVCENDILLTAGVNEFMNSLIGKIF